MTEKSTTSCDHHDETKQPSILIVIKVRFVARKSEQAPKFLTSCNLWITQRSRQIMKNHLYHWNPRKKLKKKPFYNFSGQLTFWYHAKFLAVIWYFPVQESSFIKCSDRGSSVWNYSDFFTWFGFQTFHLILSCSVQI